jgi:hypothetical protein
VTFVLYFVYVLYSIYWFVYVESSSIPGMKPTWGCDMYNLFNVLNSICRYFIENFCRYIHQRNWFIIFFF